VLSPHAAGSSGTGPRHGLDLARLDSEADPETASRINAAMNEATFETAQACLPSSLTCPAPSFA
jgi:hypothetical protein